MAELLNISKYQSTVHHAVLLVPRVFSLVKGHVPLFFRALISRDFCEVVLIRIQVRILKGQSLVTIGIFELPSRKNPEIFIKVWFTWSCTWFKIFFCASEPIFILKRRTEVWPSLTLICVQNSFKVFKKTMATVSYANVVRKATGATTNYLRTYPQQLCTVLFFYWFGTFV